jgi:hypothetical protein
VWGSGEEAVARRVANDPLLKAQMHSELGAVSPYFVIPSDRDDEWNDARIKSFAIQAVIGLTDNVSCNCLALKCLVLPEGELGDKFERIFRGVLSQTKTEVS